MLHRGNAATSAFAGTVRHGGNALAAQSFGPGHQRFLQISTARMNYRPFGVIGIIGTWNYPLLPELQLL